MRLLFENMKSAYLDPDYYLWFPVQGPDIAWWNDREDLRSESSRHYAVIMDRTER